MRECSALPETRVALPMSESNPMACRTTEVQKMGRVPCRAAVAATQL